MSTIAVHLDNEMLLRRGIVIHPSSTQDADLPTISDLAGHFENRLLVRYVRRTDLSLVTNTTWQHRPHWLTLTPLCKGSVSHFLNLPSHLPSPTHALIVDPAELPDLRGPRYVQFGFAVEYLTSALPDTAIVGPKWAAEL